MLIPQSRKPRVAVAAGIVIALLLFSAPAHGTKYPPKPSLESISGSWIALTDYGEVCRLTLNGPGGTGELSCSSEGRTYKVNVTRIELRGYDLTVLLGSSRDRLEGEVVRSKFGARLGRERMNFFTDSRVLSDLTRVGIGVCEDVGHD